MLLARTGRSGSTPASRIIAYYLNHTSGHIYLREFLNLSDRGFIWRNGELVVLNATWDTAYVAVQPNEVLARELDLRVTHAQTNPNRYFFKAFTRDIVRYRDWLFETCDIVFLFRKNYFEHLLSYLISSMTGQFYETNGISIAPGALTPTESHVVEFCEQIHDYNSIRALKQECPEIAFEDVAINDPARFIQQLGFNEEIDWSDLKLPRKQNEGAKINAFSNPEEVKNWYRESFLSALHPID
jgi:hypothetical protein